MTRSKIFFRSAGTQVLAELAKTHYPDEAVLQKALADAPEVVAGFSTTGDEPAKLLLIKREMAVPAADNSGTLRVDHLYVDATGVPVLVEVKRSSDTRLRREVVAQMLDYAASAAQEWTPEAIRGALENRAGPDTSIDAFLEEHEFSMPGTRSSRRSSISSRRADPDDIRRRRDTRISAPDHRVP